MSKKFYYHQKNRDGESVSAQKQATKRVEEPRFDAEKLNLTLKELALSDFTAELLHKNKIDTAADVVRRTEKDLYKVQGLNKKVLLEIKSAIGKHGMSLKEQPEIKQGEAAGRKDNPSCNNVKQPSSFNGAGTTVSNGRNERDATRQNGRQNDRGNRNDRYDRAERNERTDRSRGASAAVKNDRPAKLTAPLPVSEWRKIQKNGKWGFYDGFKTVIPAMYDEIFCFKDDLASVELDEQCGYIDCSNNIIIPLEYETAMSFSEGYACVVKGNKCGYINKNNEIVIPFQYDAATPFEDGEAKVKKDGKWGTLSLDGSIKWI